MTAASLVEEQSEGSATSQSGLECQLFKVVWESQVTVPEDLEAHGRFQHPLLGKETPDSIRS